MLLKLGLLTILLLVLGFGICFSKDIGMADVLKVGENRLDVKMPATVAFDPWLYDKDKSCYIETGEALEAIRDYYADVITGEQCAEVRTLYDNHTRNPACTAPPPPPPPPLTDYLTMTKDKLYTYLINGSVANDWWAMSYTNRRQLGLKIIKWWSVDWFGYGICLAVGKPDVSPYVDSSVCCYNRIGLGMETCCGFRYCLFTDRSIAPTNLYWFRSADDKWYCYDPGVCFKLPTAIATGDADWLNALQIAPDVTKLDSWIFFQTWLVDGYPGCDAHHWPNLLGYIKIYKVKGILKKTSGEFDPRGIADLGQLIAEIHY